jgi:CRP-like cAMP-binding protein
MSAQKSSNNGSAYKNLLLASLPAQEIKRLAPYLSHVNLSTNQTLHDAGAKVDTVFFLEDGICSIVATMESGSTIEVGIIGRDGFVGMAAVLGTGRATNRAYMQIPGYGFSIKAKALLARCEESAELRSCLLQGVQGLMVQTAQTAACNRVHELEERLARWLMMCYDRMQADYLPITHESLGMMLGTRRTSVTVAAGMLQKAGLIAYSRGHVTIEDRDGLKDVACECYQVVHDEYVRLGLL